MPASRHKPIDWSRQIERAEREAERNRARIEAGETFRGHQSTSRKASSKTDGKKRS